MSHSTFENFQKCVDDIMINWNNNSNKEHPPDNEVYHTADLDTQFLQDLKSELKTLTDKKRYNVLSTTFDIH